MRPDLLPTTFDGALDRLVEEAGEVLKPLGKIKRFGARAVDARTGIAYDNGEELMRELVDLLHAAREVQRLYVDECMASAPINVVNPTQQR